MLSVADVFTIDLHFTAPLKIHPSYLSTAVDKYVCNYFTGGFRVSRI